MDARTQALVRADEASPRSKRFWTAGSTARSRGSTIGAGHRSSTVADTVEIDEGRISRTASSLAGWIAAVAFSRGPAVRRVA